MLAELRSRGLTVRADGEQLYVTPGALMTDELRAEIRANKRAILRA